MRHRGARENVHPRAAVVGSVIRELGTGRAGCSSVTDPSPVRAREVVAVRVGADGHHLGYRGQWAGENSTSDMPLVVWPTRRTSRSIPAASLPNSVRLRWRPPNMTSMRRSRVEAG